MIQTPRLWASGSPVAMLAAAACGLSSGCATITGAEMQNLSLQAANQAGAPVADAECKLSNDKGSWTAKPPGFVAVNRSAEDLLVNCEATGQAPGLARAISRANSGMFGNIIFGGGIGAMIDHTKGTAYDYPSTIRVVFGASLVFDKKDEPEGASAVAVVPGAAPATAAAGPPPRHAAVVPAPAGGRSGAGESALPKPGAVFRYVWADRQYGRRQQEFQVRIASVEGGNITESFAAGGQPPIMAEVVTRAPVFLGRPLGEGQTMLEFAPYLAVDPSAGASFAASAASYPGDALHPWSVSIQSQGWEPVTVPAGTYRAVRVEVRGSRQFGNLMPGPGVARRFEYTEWYAPELRRYVKFRHRSWNVSAGQIGDEEVDLVEYRPD